MRRNKVGNQDVRLQEELPLLKARAQAIEARLHRIDRRIREMQRRTRVPSSSVAVVDPGKCLGCGRCEAACPADAISLEKTAVVAPVRCVGCGRCVAECSQGAIRLVVMARPVRRPRRPVHWT